MACFEHGTIIELAAREVVTLPDVRSATLRVTRGTLWITQEDDPQDVVLRSGDSWAVERNGLTVIEAQEDAIFCVMGRHLEPQVGRRAASVPSTVARMRDAAEAFFATPLRGPCPTSERNPPACACSRPRGAHSHRGMSRRAAFRPRLARQKYRSCRTSMTLR